MDVERAGRFIEDQQTGLPDQRTGDGDTLLLPARQASPLWAESGVDTFWQPTHFRVDVRVTRGGLARVAANAQALTTAEQEDALRRAAKQLAVEATQLHMSTPKVIDVVREELGALSNDRATDEAPVKFAVMNGGR